MINYTRRISLTFARKHEVAEMIRCKKIHEDERTREEIHGSAMTNPRELKQYQVDTCPICNLFNEKSIKLLKTLTLATLVLKCTELTHSLKKDKKNQRSEALTSHTILFHLSSSTQSKLRQRSLSNPRAFIKLTPLFSILMNLHRRP